MRTRKISRRTKTGGRPAVSRYRRKQLHQARSAMGKAFSKAYEKARGHAGSSGRESGSPLGKERRRTRGE